MENLQFNKADVSACILPSFCDTVLHIFWVLNKLFAK